MYSDINCVQKNALNSKVYEYRSYLIRLLTYTGERENNYYLVQIVFVELLQQNKRGKCTKKMISYAEKAVAFPIL